MAKVLLGEDPTEEINAVRERAYGSKYFNEHKAEIAYPNDNDPGVLCRLGQQNELKLQCAVR